MFKLNKHERAYNITDANANVVEKRLFDAWGSIIKVQDGTGKTLNGLTILDRGYTGHEHLQSIALINMNARLYDAMSRRFLQVDNYIQDLANTQNYNQYGYVVNNPLKYTDPSGNAFGDGKDCVGCNNNNYPEYNPDKMVDNKLLADEISHWVGGWASARNIDEAGTAVGKAFRDFGDFIGRNISSLFGGGRRSGPPPNRSSYVGSQLRQMADSASKWVDNAFGNDARQMVGVASQWATDYSEAHSSIGAGDIWARQMEPVKELYELGFGATGVGISNTRSFATNKVLKSFDDIVQNPESLWGLNARRVGKILGNEWEQKSLNSGAGWKFLEKGGDGFISFTTGNNHHPNSIYYKISKGSIGKYKVVGEGYRPTFNDKSKIFYARKK